MNQQEVSKEVTDLINTASRAVGNWADENFNIDCWNSSTELESPIEQFFFVAFKLVAKVNYLVNDDDQESSVRILPQYQIGKYRVDFLVSGNNHREAKIVQAVIECDGHIFHERSEAERRYEKQRDRWLQMQGWKVFRFTGKELKDDPIRTACEVISFLSGESSQELHESVRAHL